MLFGPGSCKQRNTGMRCVSKHFKSSSVGREKQSLGLMAAIIEPHYLAVCWHTAGVTHDTEPDVNRPVPSPVRLSYNSSDISRGHIKVQRISVSVTWNPSRLLKLDREELKIKKKFQDLLSSTMPIYIKNCSLRFMYWCRLEAHFSIALPL